MLTKAFQAWAHTHTNALTEALERRRAAGAEVLDLVGAGAYESGLGFPNDRLQAMAAEAARMSAVYRPDPRGQVSARQAVADFYARRGLPTDPSHIVLTPGTSMAYLYLLRLLVEPGHEVLVPRPGYPLFDDLCRFAGVRHRYYHMRAEQGRWRLDLEDLEFQCTPTTRMVMLVSPHNPLGTVSTPDELEAVADLCERNGMTLVFDEVFAEFADAPVARPRGAVILNGLSKMLSLPGMKIGWMRVDAGDALLAAVEYASDLFLPVSEIAQAMTAPLLDAVDDVSRGFADELRRRRRLVEETLGRPTVRSDGGVYVCVPLSARKDEDEVALQALAAGVLVHPGHFYDLPDHVVFTCIADSETLREGVRRLGDLV